MSDALIAACFDEAYIVGIKRYLTGIAPAAIAVVVSLVAAIAYVPYVAWQTNVFRSVDASLNVPALLFTALALGMTSRGLSPVSHGTPGWTRLLRYATE